MSSPDSILNPHIDLSIDDGGDAFPRSKLPNSDVGKERYKDNSESESLPQSRADQQNRDATGNSEFNDKHPPTLQHLKHLEAIVSSIVSKSATGTRTLESSGSKGEQRHLKNPVAFADLYHDSQLSIQQRFIDSHFRLLDSVLRYRDSNQFDRNTEQQRFIDSHFSMLNPVLHSTKFQQNTISQQETEPPAQSLDVLENLSCPRLTKSQLSVQEIGPWMDNFEITTRNISDSILKGSPQIRLSFSGRCKDDLETLLSIVVCGRDEFDDSKVRADYLIRSLIAAAVSEWVFDDPFPVLRNSDYWDVFETLFEERALNAGFDDDGIATFLEGYRKGIVYTLSTKSKLLNTQIPARASELAECLAVTIQSLLAQQKDSREIKLLRGKFARSRELWAHQVKELFLDALTFVIWLRQIKSRTTLQWPKKNATFDSTSQMHILDSGEKITFQSQKIALIVMPAAIVEGNEGSHTRTKYEALVYLNISRNVSEASAREYASEGPDNRQKQKSISLASEDMGRDARSQGLQPQIQNAEIDLDKHKGLGSKRDFEKTYTAGSPSRGKKRQKISPSPKALVQQEMSASQPQCGNCCTTKAEIWSNGLCRPCSDYYRLSRQEKQRPVGEYCEKCKTAKVPTTSWWAKKGFKKLPKTCMQCSISSSQEPEPSLQQQVRRGAEKAVPSPARKMAIGKIPKAPIIVDCIENRIVCGNCNKSFKRNGGFIRHRRCCLKLGPNDKYGIGEIAGIEPGMQDDNADGREVSGDGLGSEERISRGEMAEIDESMQGDEIEVVMVESE